MEYLFGGDVDLLAHLGIPYLTHYHPGHEIVPHGRHGPICTKDIFSYVNGLALWVEYVTV